MDPDRREEFKGRAVIELINVNYVINKVNMFL
jgi:hypothetical protein